MAGSNRVPQEGKPNLQTGSEAWSRFERAVDVVARSPPQHKTKDKKSPPKLRPRAKKQK